MCNCEGKTYNIGMGCCQPVLGPIENYYTKSQIDNMLEEIESGITSGCCITPEEVDERISAACETKLDASAYTPTDLSDYYTKEETNAQISSSTADMATKTWVTNQNYITGVDLSNYATKSEIPTVPTNVSAFNNDAGYLTDHQPLKTINGESLVGEGNITISGGVIVDNSITSGSSNPVTSSAIYNALDSKADTTVLNNYMLKSKIWCGDETAYNQIAIKDPETLYLIHA